MNKEKLLRNASKSDHSKKGKSRFNWALLWIIVPILLISIVFTWFYQSKDIVMSVGPLPITRTELEIEMQRLTPPDYEQKLNNMDEEDRKMTEDRVRAKALENLIKLKCIYLWAQNNDIEVTNEEVNAKIDEYARTFSQDGDESVDIRATLSDYGIPWRSFWNDMKYQTIYDKVITPVQNNVQVTEEELRSHYNEFAPYYDQPAQAHIFFIVVEQEEEAKNIMDQLLAGENFEKLAQEKSISPTVMTDKGDNGWVTKDELLQEIGENVFHPDLVMGEYYLMKARDGYYIFRVDDRTEEIKNTYDDVYEKIKADVLIQKQDQAVNGFMTRLSDQYESQMVVGNHWSHFLEWWDKVRGVTE